MKGPPNVGQAKFAKEEKLKSEKEKLIRLGFKKMDQGRTLKTLT